MRKEFLAEVRADVSQLGGLQRKIDWVYENAADNLNALETADAEDDGTESDYLFAISNGIRQVMDECVAFDAHFRKKYGAKEGEEGHDEKTYIVAARNHRAVHQGRPERAFGGCRL